MKGITRYSGVIAGALCLVYAAGLAGCGGSGASVAGTSTTSTSTSTGCNGVLNGATLSIQYPDRSRGGSFSTPLSSALSAKIVISGATPALKSRSADVTVNVDRDATKLAAHTEVYNLPLLATGTFNVAVTFYSGATQTGVVVGTATTSDTVSCSGHNIEEVSLSGVISTVTVTPANLTIGGSPMQLVFTAKDASGTVVPVSPGSAIFSATGSAATVTPDGIATPVSAGAVQVFANVDHIGSAAATITVSGATSTAYRIVDVGAGTAVGYYKGLNDNGKALLLSADDTPILEVVDVNTSTTTSLGVNVSNAYINNNNLIVGSFNQQSYYWQGPGYTQGTFTSAGQVFAENNLGNCVGIDGGFNATYWDSPTATSTSLGTVGGDPTHIVEPTAVNSSKVIVGNASYTTQFEACYFPSPTAGQATLLPPYGTGRSLVHDINDSGAIVGLADSGSGEYAVIWDSPTSPPRSLGSLGAPGSAEASGINNAGVVVGIDSNAPTRNQAFVYTAASGMKSLYDLCDSSRTGWTLGDAYSINNHGWIYGRGQFNGVPHAFVAIPNAP